MLTFHHVGCLVTDMEAARAVYARLFTNISPTFVIEAQRVEVCFVETGPNVYLELVRPLDESNTFTSLQKRKITYYHAGYWVDDLASAVARLREEGYSCISEFRSEAFQGRRCAFLMSPLFHLVELIESAHGTPVGD